MSQPLLPPAPSPSPPAPPPSRIIHHGDGVAWVRAATLGPAEAVVTSLPDCSELPALGFAGWRAWFIDTAELICRQLSDEAVAVFYQTDVKHDGRWVDKGFLVQLGAERAGSHLLWHKIACRVTAGTTTFGRPAYAHILCFSRNLRISPAGSTPDVLPELGKMTWSRAMGVHACEAVARFIVRQTACRTVIDPFCGLGTMLAVANAHGLDAVGVELCQKRVRRARALSLPGPAPAGGPGSLDGAVGQLAQPSQHPGGGPAGAQVDLHQADGAGPAPVAAAPGRQPGHQPQRAPEPLPLLPTPPGNVHAPDHATR